jgi:hypothetical protein
MGKAPMRPRRHTLCVFMASGAFLLSNHTAATEIVPIVVTMLGPSTVRIRVSEGTVLPCDSADDRMLIEGQFAAGEVLRATTLSRCVCVQHRKSFVVYAGEDSYPLSPDVEVLGVRAMAERLSGARTAA